MVLGALQNVPVDMASVDSHVFNRVGEENSKASEALIENAPRVELGDSSFRVVTTPKMRLKQIDFTFDGTDYRGLEQNPVTKSRWAKLAREGKKVMQFLEDGRYIAVVVNGECKPYPRK